LHHLTPLNNTHFEQWNKLFLETVDENFEGSNAELIKQRAISISMVLAQKIAQTKKSEQI
jgi:hemoglobin